MKKMNNKGFSLVELIVVVLIMAIIAVALAPQVMKWVENSRKATDCNNYDSVVSAASVAMSNEDAMTQIYKTEVAGLDLIWGTAKNAATKNGDTWLLKEKNGGESATTSCGVFYNGVVNILGANWDTNVKVKRTKDFRGVTPAGAQAADGEAWLIEIDAQGILKRSIAPSSKDIS